MSFVKDTNDNMAGLPIGERGFIRKIDLGALADKTDHRGGTVTVADLLVHGPRTLYTPSAGEMVWPLWAGGGPDDIGFPWAIVLEPINTDIVNGSAFFYQGPNVAHGLAYAAGGADAVDSALFPKTPIVVRLFHELGPLEITSIASRSWQASHRYELGEAITVTLLDGDHIEIVTTAGTSGTPTAPDFQTNEGSTTSEGDTLVWTDGGNAPTTGEVQVMALVG